jgi:hypothetical protein
MADMRFRRATKRRLEKSEKSQTQRRRDAAKGIRPRIVARLTQVKNICSQLRTELHVWAVHDGLRRTLTAILQLPWLICFADTPPHSGEVYHSSARHPTKSTIVPR